jgi:murein DD-endopeptidase MepM/ murein hydrolase activator NlpD
MENNIKPKQSLSSLFRFDALMALEDLKRQRENIGMEQEQPSMKETQGLPADQERLVDFKPLAQKFRVSQKFGNYNPDLYAGVTKGAKHWGTDIATPSGTKVFAPVSGEVVSGQDNTFGNYVKVIGDDGVIYQFSHLSKPLAQGKIKAGQAIALTGNTGKSTGAHLDIMAKRGQNYINPMELQTIKNLWL